MPLSRYRKSRDTLLNAGWKTCCVVLAGVAMTCGWPALGAPPTGYHLVWADEFNGSSLSSSKWNWGTLAWGGIYHDVGYDSYVTAADSYLTNGTLVLRCRKIPQTINGKVVNWTEGVVHHNNKFEWTYGYVEVRAKFPVMKGTWPAFWLHANQWPPEFDVAEYFGSEDRLHLGYVYENSSGDAVWSGVQPTSLYSEGFGNWHTYGLAWGPGWAKWYRDGVVRRSITASYIANERMWVILNSGMGSGQDASTTDPNYTYFDYCRIYFPGASTRPTLTSLNNCATRTNTPTPPLPFVMDDAETPLDQLTLTASSSNTNLVPVENIVFSGTTELRTVVVTPALNQSGAASITLSLFDGEHTTNQTFTVTVSNAPPARLTTTTTLTASRNPSAVGAPVTFTATVRTNGVPAGGTTGWVIFKDNTTPLSTNVLSGGQASFATDAISFGSHLMRVEYIGDGTCLASTSPPVAHYVQTTASTSLTLASSANPSAAGNVITFSAALQSAGFPPASAGGAMVFRTGGVAVSTNGLFGGVAEFSTSELPLGAHQFTAEYSGEPFYFLASTSAPLSQVVQLPTPSTTLLSASPNPSAEGAGVTFTATVWTNGVVAGDATGAMLFKDGAIPLSTNAVSDGVAVFQTSALAVGSHPVKAEFGGHGIFLASTSPPVAQVVLAIPTTPTNLAWSLEADQLTLSWPGYLGWVLQSQSNGLDQGLGANWNDVIGTEGTTSTNVPVFPGAPAVFYRLRSP